MATQSPQISEEIGALTDKEKEVLRLILRGYDAKSMARELELSVHTINERLRHARRKLEVSSSREAARMLAEHEREQDKVDPQSFAPKKMGGADQSSTDKPVHAVAGKRIRRIFAGVIIMSLALALLYFSSPMVSLDNVASSESSATSTTTSDQVYESAALEWLKLVDAEKWQASFDAAGKQFKAPNRVEIWKKASELARGPLGRVLNREMIAVEKVNAPPNGYTVVKFKTDFENRARVIENVTLEDEGDAWRVVGYFLT